MRRCLYRGKTNTIKIYFKYFGLCSLTPETGQLRQKLFRDKRGILLYNTNMDGSARKFMQFLMVLAAAFRRHTLS